MSGKGERSRIKARRAGRGAARPYDLDPERDLDEEIVRYYAARAAEYDDAYLRRGRHRRGPQEDEAWAVDLARAHAWLDRVPFRGDLVELAAGTGWWSPQLAAKGDLAAYDASWETLEYARERLAGRGLSARLEIRDAWTEPDRVVNGLFAGYWLSHISRARLTEFFGIVNKWLAVGGVFAFIDSRPGSQVGEIDNALPHDDVQIRDLGDGRTFRIRKVYYRPDILVDALRLAGFADIEILETDFLLLGSARRS
jgi:demethylmenaquinone methyltransferase/2-methoxy-6-polyprenyl-1,4-benzoquinol methylase